MPLETLQESFDRLRAGAAADPYPPAERRIADLLAVEKALIRRKDALAAAADADFGGRLRHETLFAEIYVTAEAFRHSRRHLTAWMKPRRRSVPLPIGLGRARVIPQPLGVVGILSPWNYPLMLALTPVAGALAAGNRVMVKPSELTPSVTTLIAEILAEALPSDRAAVISGGTEIGAAFASLPFDHILFTGSERIGRKVMAAAAENLTPVTLELGGKSPALILPGADLGEAALDIAYGKFTNAGQTCVAPDYVLVPRGAMDEFLDRLERAVAAYFPAGQESSTMSAVFGEAGRRRQTALRAEAAAAGVTLRELGPSVPGLAFGPTVLIDPPESLALSREEIFGPLLPVIPYDDVATAVDHIRHRPRPLALYLFGKDRSKIDGILRSTLSGGAVVNDTLVHVAIEDLPFGGVGPSGMGRYHGREGFECFSHMRAVFERSGPRLDRLARPPLRALHERLARWLIGG